MASPSNRSTDSFDFEMITPTLSPDREPHAVTDTEESAKVVSVGDDNLSEMSEMTPPATFNCLASRFIAAGAESVKPKMKEKAPFPDGPHDSTPTTDSNERHFTVTTKPSKQAHIPQSDGTGKETVVLRLRQHSDHKLSSFAETTSDAFAMPEQVKQMSPAFTPEQVKQQVKLLKGLLSTWESIGADPPSTRETPTEEGTKSATDHKSASQSKFKLGGDEQDDDQDDDLPQVDYPLSQQIYNGEICGPLAAIGRSSHENGDSYFAIEPIKVIVGTDEPQAYYVHKDNLAISPVLERMCLKSAVKNGKCLSLPDDDPFDFEYLIGFLYNETLSTAPLEGNDNRLLDLYILASKYELAGMKSQVYGALNLDFHFPELCETVVKVYSAGAADEGFRMLVKNKVVSTLQATFCVGGWAPSLRILTASAHLDTTLAQDITEALMKEVEKTVVDSRNTCWGVDANDDAVRYCPPCGLYHSDWLGCAHYQGCPAGSPGPPPLEPAPRPGWNDGEDVANDNRGPDKVEKLLEELAALTQRINQMEVTKIQGTVPQPYGAQAAVGPVGWGQPPYVPPPPPPPPVPFYTNAAAPHGQTVTAVKASSGEDCTLSFPKGARIMNTNFLRYDDCVTRETWQGTYNGLTSTFPYHYIQAASG